MTVHFVRENERLTLTLMGMEEAREHRLRDDVRESVT